MSHEQTPTIPAENMYEVHKTDVKAIRELGGLAFAGPAEPGAELSKRSEYLLEQAGGDVKAAADLAKHEANRINGQMGDIVSDNLDQYIDQAREDMEQDKIKQAQEAKYGSNPRLLSNETMYKLRREQGIPLGGDEPEARPRKPLKRMEAAIDPRTGQTVLPAEHYANRPDRYAPENARLA